MAQQVTLLATSDVSLIPGTQIAEGENSPPKLSLTNHRKQCLGARHTQLLEDKC